MSILKEIAKVLWLDVKKILGILFQSDWIIWLQRELWKKCQKTPFFQLQGRAKAAKKLDRLL